MTITVKPTFRPESSNAVGQQVLFDLYRDGELVTSSLTAYELILRGLDSHVPSNLSQYGAAAPHDFGPVPWLQKMDHAEHAGDWHDAPLRYRVNGPGTECQKFSNKKEADKYRVFRRRFATQREAGDAWHSWAMAQD